MKTETRGRKVEATNEPDNQDDDDDGDETQTTKTTEEAGSGGSSYLEPKVMATTRSVDITQYTTHT